jgi:hypothetical protein
MALVSLLRGIIEAPRMLGVGILSMGFYAGLWLLFLLISRLGKPA